MTSTLSVMSEELLRVLLAQEDGLSDEQLQSTFGAQYTQLPPAINELLKLNRIQLFTQNGGIVYRAMKEETAVKLEGLGSDQMLVYQTCQRAGNKGIWKKDIRIATNIQQEKVTKILKVLEQRNLIKGIRSVVNNSKILYMLYEMVPAKEVTGGPWYSDHEFDHDFVSALSDFIVKIVEKQNIVDLTGICDKIRISGISKVELSIEEIGQVVNTLVYDGRLEEVQSSVLLMTGYATTKKMFKINRNINPPNFLTATPCGVCPVLSQCVEGGVISPTNCLYMDQWLVMPAEDYSW
eukprot:gene5909-8152_t